MGTLSWYLSKIRISNYETCRDLLVIELILLRVFITKNVVNRYELLRLLMGNHKVHTNARPLSVRWQAPVAYY